MKSFRRHCGEGITTPVGMREAGIEGEGKTRGMKEGWKRRGKGYKLWKNEKSTWAKKIMSGGETRRTKKTHKPKIHERIIEARWQTGTAGWWLFPDNICGFSGVRELPSLPPIISLPCSAVSGLVHQAELCNCQEPESWNALWCFKHDAVVGRSYTRQCLVNKWGLTWQFELKN